jgi:SAM-dependent methyltransferase
MARPPALAHRRFQPHADELRALALREKFAWIFEHNLWGSADSRSGLGSAPDETARLRAGLPPLLRKWNVRTLLDVPCGDFGWLRTVDLPCDYIGADIVREIVLPLQQDFAGDPRRRFVCLDLTRDPLPACDLVLCRDCLVHLSYANISRALANIASSGVPYLLTTTFLAWEANTDIEDGDWRPLNFQQPPFSFPAPLDVLIEGCIEGGGAYADKALALWPLPVSPPVQAE